MEIVMSCFADHQVDYHSKQGRKNCFLIRMLREREKKNMLDGGKKQKKQPQIMTNSISNAAAALLTP